MLARSACRRGAAGQPLLPSPPPVQQRLYTGYLFTEEISRDLRAFAQRHQLTSCVWIPKKAFDTVLKPLGVFILPYAVLCDTSAGGTGSGGTTGIREHVLVNADHTSNPALFESFRELLVPSPTTAAPTPGPRGSLTEDAHAVGRHPADCPLDQSQLWPLGCTPRALDLGPPPLSSYPSPHTTRAPSAAPRAAAGGLDMPVTAWGEPILDPVVVASLRERRLTHGWRGSYWLRRGLEGVGGSAGSYYHAQETETPGRYNPTASTGYEPVSLTGTLFPRVLSVRMRERATRCGYVSRVWVTRREAEGLVGTRLRPERADDVPVIFNATGSVGPVALYCADQFEDSERLFLTPREIALAARGVRLPTGKLRAYPLLHRLSLEADRAAGMSVGSETALGGGRVGADTAKHDAERHARLADVRAQLAEVRLLGTRSPQEERWLLADGLLQKLQEQAILKDFPTAHYVSHRHVHLYGLRVAAEEVGFVSNQRPRWLWDNVWLDGEVWFNVSQLTEPLVGLQLFYRHPCLLLTRCRLGRDLGRVCCQVQLQMGYRSCEWVPDDVLRDAGWPVRAGAPSVPYATALLGRDYLRGPDADAAARRRGGCGSLYNLDEIGLPVESAEWLRAYRPVDEQGHPYLRTLRALLTLRAHERGYASPVWVPLAPSSHYICRATPAPPAPAEGCPPPAAVTNLSRAGDPFATPPLVRFRGVLYANVVDVVNLDVDTIVPPVPLAEMSPSARTREEQGEGVSAETLRRAGWGVGRQTAGWPQPPQREAGTSGEPPGDGEEADSDFDLLIDDN